MLQSVEYRNSDYLNWYWQVDHFSQVAKRKTLEKTAVAKALLAAAWVILAVIILLAAWLAFLGYNQDRPGFYLLAAGLAVASPVLVAQLLIIPVALGNAFILQPQRRRMYAQAKEIYKNHKAKKIAVAGSYGKTTMKELLATVLGDSKKVGATPGNFNTPIAHARFASSLSGDEEVLIIEYGEFEPGDVLEFAKMTSPDMAVITGLNASHLDTFGSLEVTGRTIFGVADYLKDKNVYVSGEDADLKEFTKPKHIVYSLKGVDGWKISDTKCDLSGTSFSMKKGIREIKVKSGLLGEHNVAPLAVAAAIASNMGISTADIEKSFKKTKPYEHRFEPKQLGAGSNITIIDDTYNGNIDGVRAGLKFLKNIKAKRKVYITPGLVEQGIMTQPVHEEMGRLIADAADVVYLIQNSVTPHIVAGLEEAGFKGELNLVDDPVQLYTNLESISKDGDVILMQNDWTDNYR